jgi:hypothetical protein
MNDDDEKEKKVSLSDAQVDDDDGIKGYWMRCFTMPERHLIVKFETN